MKQAQLQNVDWSEIKIEHDIDVITTKALSQLDAARCVPFDAAKALLCCPDTLTPMTGNTTGSLRFPDGSPMLMKGARPVLLPEFARSRIAQNQYAFDKHSGLQPNVQYLYLADVKAHGGDQNSDYEDVWYHRHLFRTRRLTDGATGTLLDIGCDTPSISSRMFPANVDYIGLEPSLIASDQFCICGMAEFLPFKNCSFDNVALLTSLDHILDDHKAIDEAWRVLRPGGSLYLASLIWTKRASLIGDTVHFHHFRDWEIQGLLRNFTLEFVHRYSWKENDHRYGVYLKARKSPA